MDADGGGEGEEEDVMSEAVFPACCCTAVDRSAG